MRAMMDPNNLRAMLQMEQAMQQLSGSMPGLQVGAAQGFRGSAAAGGSAVPPPPAAGGLDFSSLLGASGTASSGAGGVPAAAAPMANPFMFPLMPPAAGGQQQPGSSAQPAPGQRFRVQLQNLQDMGFTDRSANIRALTSSHGNVNRAIEILLENPPEMGGSEPAAAEVAGGGDNAAAGADSQADAAGNDSGAAAGESSEPKGNTEKKND